MPPSGSKANAAYHTIHVPNMSVRVPPSWHETGSSTPFGTTTWTVQSPRGFDVQLTATPLEGNPFQLLPIQPQNGGRIPRGTSPYDEVSTQGDQISEQLLSASGTLYGLSVYASTPAAARRIWHSWVHPPVSSVTQAVSHMEWMHDAFPSYVRTFGTRHQGWIMVGGMPATAQHSYFLFDTHNGGRTWSLERYTVWSGCSQTTSAQCVFPGLTGSLSMTFWNAEDGAIVQATMVENELAFYRTDDGGATWVSANIPVNHPAQNAVIRYVGNRLLLTIQFYGPYPSVTEVSMNGGAVWSVVSS